jgi:hypothetical protein
MSLLIYFKDIISKFRSSDAHDKNVFDHYFFDLKYYLNKDASVEHFANLLNSKPEKLDKIAHAYYSNAFQLLINEYRYKHFLSEFESPLSANLSIDSIIKLSGFESNENFVAYVKEKQEKINKH